MKKNPSLLSACLFLFLISVTVFSRIGDVRNLDSVSIINEHFARGENVYVSGSEENAATFVGIAKYYDNRRCVVTSSHDDLRSNTSDWESCLSMLTKKKIYHTVGIITNETDWNYVQHWLDQGYTEASSHSRNHIHPPYEGTEYGEQKVGYEWQINGSKQDIIGNLTLPSFWRCGENKYVYVWIEPYGQSDEKVRHWLGLSHYLCDRSISATVYGFASWDSSNELFERKGYTVEVGDSPWGGDTSVYSLNSKFDRAYREGGIYHFITHPSWVNWSEGGYADQHTDYISNRSDVWYVPLGLLYLYHWVNVRNTTQVAFMEYGLHGVFRISIDQHSHEMYGVSYPITYVFGIPQNWTSGYVYYRYGDVDPWMLLANKSSKDFFNGIDASRFDFSEHKAYVSVAFTQISDNIYVQIRPSSLRGGTPVANAGQNRTVYRGEQVAFNASGSRDNGAEIIRYEWDFGDGTNGTGVETNHVYTKLGIYDVKLTIIDSEGNLGSAYVTIDVKEPSVWWEMRVALLAGNLALVTIIVLEKVKETRRLKTKVGSNTISRCSAATNST